MTQSQNYFACQSVTLRTRPRSIAGITEALHVCDKQVKNKGVGTTGATGALGGGAALAPAMLKPRGRKHLFARAILRQVY